MKNNVELGLMKQIYDKDGVTIWYCRCRLDPHTKDHLVISHGNLPVKYVYIPEPEKLTGDHYAPLKTQLAEQEAWDDLHTY